MSPCFTMGLVSQVCMYGFYYPAIMRKHNCMEQTFIYMHKQLEKKQKTKEKGVERYSDEESCYNQKKISLTLIYCSSSLPSLLRVV